MVDIEFVVSVGVGSSVIFMSRPLIGQEGDILAGSLKFTEFCNFQRTCRYVLVTCNRIVVTSFVRYKLIFVS